MRSISELLAAAQATMMKWPALWLPACLISALQLMAGGPYVNMAAQVTVLITSNLGAFVAEAGWLALIKRAVKDEPVHMEDFKAGVNRYWASLIMGNVAFYLLLGALLGVTVAAGDALYSRVALEHWYAGLKDIPPEKLDAMLRPDLLPPKVQGWMGLFAGWMAVTTLLGYLLLFWEQVVVMRGVGWWHGWLGSMKLALSRFRQTIVLVALHALVLFSSLVVLSSGSAVGAMLGLGMLLLIMTYFKILYATLVADTWPPAVDAVA